MTKAMNEELIKSELSRRLKPSRYEHSLGVRDTAVFLAQRFGVDERKAAIAGLLHDCAREFPAEKMLEEAKKRGLDTTGVYSVVPFLLHAPLGAVRAKEVYGVTDDDILSAIACHTVGGENMTALDKIIYYADMIEPNRAYPEVEMLRALAEKAPLDDMLLEGLSQSIIFVVKKGGLLHPDTIKARNEILGNISRSSSCDMLPKKV